MVHRGHRFGEWGECCQIQHGSDPVGNQKALAPDHVQARPPGIVAADSGARPAAVVLERERLHLMVQPDGGHTPDTRGRVPREDRGLLERFRGCLDPEPVLLPRFQLPPGRPVHVDAMAHTDEGAGLHPLGDVIRVQAAQDAVAGQEKRGKVLHIPKLPALDRAGEGLAPLCGELLATRICRRDSQLTRRG